MILTNIKIYKIHKRKRTTQNEQQAARNLKSDKNYYLKQEPIKNVFKFVLCRQALKEYRELADFRVSGKLFQMWIWRKKNEEDNCCLALFGYSM